ncbi:MAG TPA: acylphosphatase [Rudaea sp.]|nr:acylphosphatase [Rudaea sp.]
MPCAKFNVRGRVQGVAFRASTRGMARRLGLTGHAKNLPDGRVEVLACGDAAALDELESWLRRGPPAARVDAVTRTVAEIPPPASFTTA